MIEQLMVKNYILFDSAFVDFTNGMSAITGETGAGKSLLIDAIGYLSGNRITGNIVRQGKSKCVLQMVLSCDEMMARFLEENDFDVDDSIVISRTVTANQKSTIRVNQQITTLSFVRKLVEKMVDVHSQMDTFQLMKLNVQMDLLDSYAKAEPLKKEVCRAYMAYKDVADTLEKLEKETLSDDELDYITARYNEIEEADVQPSELEELQEKICVLNEASKHLESYSQAIYNIEAENGLMDRMYDLYKNLESIHSEDANEIHEMYYRLDEIKEQLQERLDTYQSQVEDLDRYNAREYEIRTLFKKHGGSYESLMAAKEKYIEQIDHILHRDNVLEKLKNKKAQKEKEYITLAKKLSKTRIACFNTLSKQVEKHCQDLMLEHARFKIMRQEKPYSKDGIDDIEFMVSMNPGQPFAPLKDSASGGELSRLMLALKVVFQSQEGVSTLIFDEIDTGVSGKVAFAMGQKMHALSKSYQVLCITHLPSVAAWADTHYRVFKTSTKDKTVTNVEYLDEKKTLEELAMMSSGTVTKASLQAAEELKERCHG